MTDVQKAAVTAIEEKKNLFIQAKTGAGKTYAYLIPALERIESENPDTQVLIIAPTRELAVQAGESAEKICPHFNVHHVVCIGGLDIDRQINALRHRPQMIIGTPGRLNDLLEQKKIDLSSLSLVIYDEADQIITTGQKEEVISMMKSFPETVQTVEMSATYHELLSSFLPEDTEHVILDENRTNENIDLRYIRTDDRKETLTALFSHLPITSCIVFTNYRNDANELNEYLQSKGYLSAAFSSFLDEKKRLSVIRQFKEGTVRILCATDAAARGLDISEVSHIIHYDIPLDRETFIHRSGRSAHQENTTGTSILLVSPDYSDVILHDLMPMEIDTSYENDMTVPLEKKKEQPDILKIRIHAGRKDKIRPKDVIGALCSIMDFKDIGTLEIQDTFSSVILLNRNISLPERITIKGKKRKLSIWN